ncbi:MAG: flagellar basal-body rod protein FlgF [Selenomonadaceae bacterium]|nr:flagellar basal-body rod protein FlgF [Selenomonadaceae bacterium]
MWRGLYTAATGMITETQRTDVISNNLANAATTGYKRDFTVHREFENMLIKRVYDHADGGSVGIVAEGFNILGNLGTSSDDVTKIKGFSVDNTNNDGIGKLGLGDYVAEVAVDYQQGPLQTTGNTLDLAISGEGFFAVQTPDGVRYTRNGAFFRNQNGVLQDIRGYNVLDTNGQPITIPNDVGNDKIVVTGDGTIYAPANQRNQPQRQLAQIQLVQFDNRLATQKQGDNLFYAVTDNNGNVAQPQQATGQIIQGMLEKSNVQVVSAMVELIHNQRMYEAGAKSVTTQDTMLETSVNQVGRLS